VPDRASDCSAGVTRRRKLLGVQRRPRPEAGRGCAPLRCSVRAWRAALSSPRCGAARAS